MKVKCIYSEDNVFTFGKVYDVLYVDDDGDFWVTDDRGYEYFFFPDECEVVEE